MFSVAEYKKQYYSKHPLAEAMGGISDFEAELFFYIDEVSMDNPVIGEEHRKGLERLALSFIKDQLPHKEVDEFIGTTGDWFQLMFMLQKCGLSKNELEEWDDKFYSGYFEKKLKPEAEIDFSTFWYLNLNFLDFRFDYYSRIRIGTTERELMDQFLIFQKFRGEINGIRIEDYRSFLGWVKHCCFYYKNLPHQLDASLSRYTDFIEQILAWGIAECRNNAEFRLLSRYIVYREELITSKEPRRWKKEVRKLVGWFTGYGEKPCRLLWLFSGLAVLFTVVYCVLPGIDGVEGSAIEKIVSALYLYVTTSLTVGYGDITPTTSLAKVIVMVNEVAGFCIGGAFISLSLRKLFRY